MQSNRNLSTWVPNIGKSVTLEVKRSRHQRLHSIQCYSPNQQSGYYSTRTVGNTFNHDYQWSFGTSSPLSVPMPEFLGRQDIMMSDECTLYSALDRHTTALCPLNCMVTLKLSLIVGLLGQQQISEWPSRPSKALLQPEVDNNLLCPMATIP